MVSIKLKRKTIKVDAKECQGIWKVIGLIFSRQNSARAKIFKFKRPSRMSIHSIFCPKFLAIWLLKGQVVDYEIVDKTRFSIKPASNFDTLIEVPINKKYEKVLKSFKAS